MGGVGPTTTQVKRLPEVRVRLRGVDSVTPPPLS